MMNDFVKFLSLSFPFYNRLQCAKSGFNFTLCWLGIKAFACVFKYMVNIVEPPLVKGVN